MDQQTTNAAWGTLKYRDAAGKEVVLALNKPLFRIGRLADNDLQLDDPYVSRLHVELRFDGTQAVLVDRSSTGATYVNDQRVSESRLRNADRLSLGRKMAGAEMIFEYVNQDAKQPEGNDPHQVMSVIDHSQTRYLNTSLIRAANLTNAATVNRLKALYEITSAILAVTTREELAEKLLTLLFDLLPAERGVILLADPKDNSLRQQAARLRNGDAAQVSPSQTIVHRVYEGNVAELCLDARNDARFASQQSIIFQSIRSVMCAPISSATRTWGVCYLDNLTTKKTFEDEELEFLMAVSRQAGLALENIYLLEEQKITFQSFVTTLAASIDARDDLTAGHSARVARYSRSIAKYMNLSEAERRRIYYAGLLHDYGKIGTREAILCKPGKLTPEEYAHMRDHAKNTFDILSKIHFTREMQDLPLVAAGHHENLDGSGYPFGLKGDEIPIGARIIAVADFFDALTHKRHYREPMPIEEVLELIDESTGSKFDPRVVAALKQFVVNEFLPNQRKRAEAEARRAQSVQQVGDITGEVTAPSEDTTMAVAPPKTVSMDPVLL
ncbi:MAG: HD domain-containing phosphohydrolase [Chloracidobacterium sp.]|uniref:HD domain-containing protein n=1 Tax=Chloracidobacterium validum TaxID=2821543 RepID=A0ABX8B754_9BACT|nr:HD domain-containing phosphohydrolase [Chloracidobacterium validum]QUW02476.1 HD domain-containing protein [Chloracidobacterium validum]